MPSQCISCSVLQLHQPVSSCITDEPAVSCADTEHRWSRIARALDAGRVGLPVVNLKCMPSGGEADNAGPPTFLVPGTHAEAVAAMGSWGPADDAPCDNRVVYYCVFQQHDDPAFSAPHRKAVV